MFFQQNKLAIKVFVFHWKVYVLLALFSDKFKCIWLILFNVFFWDLIVFGVNVLEPLYFFWKLHSELSHNLYSPRVSQNESVDLASCNHLGHNKVASCTAIVLCSLNIFYPLCYCQHRHCVLMSMVESSYKKKTEEEILDYVSRKCQNMNCPCKCQILF